MLHMQIHYLGDLSQIFSQILPTDSSRVDNNHNYVTVI